MWYILCFFLSRATFKMFCKWFYCLTMLYKMYSAICDFYVCSLILDGRSSSVVFWIDCVKKKKKYCIINSELCLRIPVIVVPKIWMWMKCNAERNIFACDLQSWQEHLNVKLYQGEYRKGATKIRTTAFSRVAKQPLKCFIISRYTPN
jgi:hypothetical protein